MSSIVIRNFIGEDALEQKLHKHNIAATCAINAQLHDGSLRPIPCPEEVCSHAFQPRSIWSNSECDCIANPNETLYSETNDFVFWKQHGSFPKKSGCFCTGDEVLIGMGYPSRRLTASGAGSGCNFDPHVYYYTHVAEFCNGCESEGPLSPPSNQVCGAGSVGGGSAPTPGLNITKRRIYKATAGWKSGDEGGVQNNSGITLVAEVGATSGAGGGVLSNTTMISPITQNMLTMPSNGHGIGVSAFSVFVWRNDTIYFSAPGMTDVMLPEGEMRFDHDIIAAHYWDGSIYVFTEKWNYIIEEEATNSGVVRSNPPVRYELHAPIKNQYSITSGALGVYYISSTGIVVLNGRSAVNLGSTLMPTSKWRSMNLTNAKLHVHQQYLFLYSRDWSYAHIFETEDSAFQNIQYSNHVRYPYSISATHENQDGDMLFASGNTTYKFIEETCEDRTDCEPMSALCSPCCPYDYSISTQDDVELLDIAAAYLHIDATFGDVKFTLWDGECGKKLIYEKTLEGCGIHEFKLPSCRSSSAYHTVQLEGCATVFEMRLSSDNKQMGLNSS